MKNRIKNVNGIEIEPTDKEQEELEAEESLIELVVEEEEPIAIEQSAEKEVIFTKPEEYIPPPPVILPPEPEMIIVAESKGVWALPLLLFWKRRRRNG